VVAIDPRGNSDYTLNNTAIVEVTPGAMLRPGAISVDLTTDLEKL